MSRLTGSGSFEQVTPIEPLRDRVGARWSRISGQDATGHCGPFRSEPLRPSSFRLIAGCVQPWWSAAKSIRRTVFFNTTPSFGCHKAGVNSVRSLFTLAAYFSVDAILAPTGADELERSAAVSSPDHISYRHPAVSQICRVHANTAATFGRLTNSAGFTSTAVNRPSDPVSRRSGTCRRTASPSRPLIGWPMIQAARESKSATRSRSSSNRLSYGTWPPVVAGQNGPG